MAFTNINKSSDHFTTHIYTGSNSAPNAQTGIGHQPDSVWIKPRNLANSHRWHSTLLTAPDYYVMPENTDAEATNDNCITSFNSDGFTLGNTDNGWNGNYNYVSWNWKANGQGSSNTDGSINTTYTSANTTSGFSMVKYTGTGSNATVGHGLGVAPKVVMIKNLARAENWLVGHSSLGFTKFLSIDITNAAQTTSNRFNDTAPTSTVFSVGTSDGSNKSGDSFIAYCFAEKAGFFSAGSYKGGGNADGSFVQTNFRPGLVIVKNYETTDQYQMFDSKRGINGAMGFVYPDSHEAETATVPMDIYSNGFKFRDTSQARNGTNYDFIYMAWAEAPIVGSNNVPCTAR